jgi:hypothetical protein
MSETRKVTTELRKAETALRKFDARNDGAAALYDSAVQRINDERQEYIRSLDPELVRKLRAIGVLEESE